MYIIKIKEDKGISTFHLTETQLSQLSYRLDLFEKSLQGNWDPFALQWNCLILPVPA